MKPSTLRILCGSATAALLAVGPVTVADAHGLSTVPRPMAAGGDPCNGDPNCSSGNATSPSGGPYQGTQPLGEDERVVSKAQEGVEKSSVAGLLHTGARCS